MVTGATGFIGANLTRHLLRCGHEVHLLVRRGYNTWSVNEILSDVILHEVHFLDQTSLEQAVANIRPEWIFHLAAYGAYSSQSDLNKMIQTNIIGTINLVNACFKTGFEAFVNTGSSSEYGYKDHAPSETETLEPNSHYAVTKASATMFCRYVAQSQRVHIPTLRLYSVYGPYEEPKRLMPTLIHYGLEGKLPPLVHPEINHDFVYVDDVSEAYIRAASQPNQELGAVYNVGTGTQTSMRQVVRVAKKILDIPAEPVWGSMPDREWDTNIWVADNRKIRETLGWRPRYRLEEGFRRMVNWFRKNPAVMDHYCSSRHPGRGPERPR